MASNNFDVFCDASVANACFFLVMSNHTTRSLLMVPLVSSCVRASATEFRAIFCVMGVWRQVLPEDEASLQQLERRAHGLRA